MQLARLYPGSRPCVRPRTFELRENPKAFRRLPVSLGRL